MEPLVVLVTAGSSDEAASLAHTLVGERLAACVNIVPGLRSIYRWQGRVEDTAEVLLTIKTARHLLPALIDRIQALHSYSVPEVLALPVAGGAAPYLEWLAGEIRGPAGTETE